MVANICYYIWRKSKGISIPGLPQYFHSCLQIDRCDPTGDPICKNGATCVIHPNREITCKCTKGYQGKHCENSKKICESIYVFCNITIYENAR